MRENVVQSKVVDRDYRVTRTCGGLWIEVLDYHAEPLLLSGDRLAEFGYSGAEADDPAARNAELERRAVEAESALEEALAMLDRQVRQAATANAELDAIRRRLLARQAPAADSRRVDLDA